MTGSIVVRKRTNERGSKVKTGCATCRIRKVKCDENKPFCEKCVNTGRTCDGYESRFRSLNIHLITNANAGGMKSGSSSKPIRSNLIEITPQDIDLLNHYFSTKTMFNVQLDCAREAKQVLQASLTAPAIRHAVSSLRALREDLEVSGDRPAFTTQQTPSYYHGLQQYSLALRGLVSSLSSPSSNGLKSALLCCQILISIEQVRKNYAAMAQHITRGLEIVREYRVRPVFHTRNGLLPAYHDQLPLLDVFIIKLFAAPCKFADSPITSNMNGTTLSKGSALPHQRSVASQYLRTIVPDLRKELTRIAGSTLQFLGKVSRVQSVGVAIQLSSEKAALLDSLDCWHGNLGFLQKEMGFLSSEPVSVSFMRLFHLILKIVVLGALDSSPGLCAELQTENERLQSIADNVSERVRAYCTCTGISTSRDEQCIVR